MRFLIGLVIGAGLTLAAATVFGVKPETMVERIGALWTDLRDGAGELAPAVADAVEGLNSGEALNSVNSNEGLDSIAPSGDDPRTDIASPWADELQALRDPATAIDDRPLPTAVNPHRPGASPARSSTGSR